MDYPQRRLSRQIAQLDLPRQSIHGNPQRLPLLLPGIHSSRRDQAILHHKPRSNQDRHPSSLHRGQYSIPKGTILRHKSKLPRRSAVPNKRSIFPRAKHPLSSPLEKLHLQTAILSRHPSRFPPQALSLFRHTSHLHSHPLGNQTHSTLPPRLQSLFTTTHRKRLHTIP